jgi:hypothetical protein
MFLSRKQETTSVENKAPVARARRTKSGGAEPVLVRRVWLYHPDVPTPDDRRPTVRSARCPAHPGQAGHEAL